MDILPEEIQTIWNIIRGKEIYARKGHSTHLVINGNDVEQANCSHVEKIRRRRTRVSPIQLPRELGNCMTIPKRNVSNAWSAHIIAYLTERLNRRAPATFNISEERVSGRRTCSSNCLLKGRRFPWRAHTVTYSASPGTFPTVEEKGR
jgi:hypothetical protein